MAAKITKYTSTQIDVKLEFSNPIYISLDALHPDDIVVTCINNGVFISAIDFRTTTILSSYSNKVMPR